MIFKGRRKITTDITSDMLKESEVLLKQVINTAMITHTQNRREIEYLLEYSKGDQPILRKTKAIRPEINNIMVINHADMITRNIVGYFLGTPIQYTQANGEDKVKKQIDMLNRFVAYEGKHSTDGEIGQYQSRCGTAYRIIYTDGIFKDEVPFEDKALTPHNTFVVYENSIAEIPVMGVHYFDIYDEKGDRKGVKYQVYTDYGEYVITSAGSEGLLDEQAEVSFKQYLVGGVPIIEYPNNIWRMGDWEIALSLMDAINELQSGRLDDIDQVVQSLLVFINAELDADKYDELRASGIISLKNNSGNPSDVKTITNTLDQSGMNLYAQELESLLYAIIGIPDRNNRKGGGGDTGQAVELRDGWADLEVVARNKELMFKRSEKLALKVMLTIMNNKLSTGLSLLDIDIKFSRNKNNNLLVKTQSFSTLLATKTLSPADCLAIVDIVSDVNEYIARGEAFWGDEFALKASEAEQVASNTQNMNGEPVTEDQTTQSDS